MKYYSCLKDDEHWILSLAYLCVILEQLINSTCKDKAGNVIKFVDALKAFKDKLANWKRKIKIKSCVMFEKLNMLLDSKQKKMPHKNGEVYF